MDSAGNTDTLIGIELEEMRGVRLRPDMQQERREAIRGLLEANVFAPCLPDNVADSLSRGPYRLRLAIDHGRLRFDVRDQADQPVRVFILSLHPFESLLRAYFAQCESYYACLHDYCSLNRIETLDMGRRGLHNQGAKLLRDRLDGKVVVDEPTARLLFTLICALHIRRHR